MAMHSDRVGRLLVLLGCLWSVGCSGLAGLERTSHEVLWQRYQAAVDDAETASPSEISLQLQAVVPSNPSLRWRGEPGRSEVLVVTWTDWRGYDGGAGSEMTLGKDVWVTLVPDLQAFCRRLPQGHAKGVSRRIEQVLGLPPDGGRDRFVEIWASPGDLLRPCPDPEISDFECGLDFPGSAYSTLSPHYRTWFENLVATTDGEGGYPWTRLGYTYDWGGRRGREVGLSELLIRKGAQVTLAAVHEELTYCQ